MTAPLAFEHLGEEEFGRADVLGVGDPVAGEVQQVEVAAAQQGPQRRFRAGQRGRAEALLEEVGLLPDSGARCSRTRPVRAQDTTSLGPSPEGRLG